MQYGICPLSLIPMRTHPDDTAELLTQLLYGEYFRILELRKSWSRIRNTFDSCEGWVRNILYSEPTLENYESLESSNSEIWCNDLVSIVLDESDHFIPVVLGSGVAHTPLMKHRFDVEARPGSQLKSKLRSLAMLYLNAPEFTGGKSPFGIDSSGLIQMVYKMAGYPLPRFAGLRASQGEALSFIEESEEGDLAFFDNDQGVIDHVGMILSENYIIHSYGKVRVDRLDHTGIFNMELNRYSHALRVIKKVV